MPRKLNKQDLESFRELLDRLRRVISGDIEDLATDAFADAGVKGSVDNPADSGSDSFAQEFSLELLQRDETTLGEIIEALERIDQGTFGRCEACEGWIPKTRLRAMPHTRHCVDCQRAAEAAR